jgi:hypothetical protein
VLAALFVVDGGGYVGINFIKRAGHAVVVHGKPPAYQPSALSRAANRRTLKDTPRREALQAA